MTDPRIQTEPIESLASSKICMGYRLEDARISHKRTLRSSEPVAKTLESSLKARALIFKWWPWNCRIIRPLTESQKKAKRSPPQLAKVLES